MPMPSFLCFLLVLLCNFSPSFATGLMTGAWDAPSRYVGLRYECPGVYSPRPFALTLRDLADDLSAFGWVQVSSNGTGVVVGEFRGTHSTAPVFEAALQAGPPGVGVPCLTLHYPSTLIRFHFADFKILADARETCFDAPPHQCPTAGGDTTDTPSNTPPHSSEGPGRGEGEGEDSAGGTEEVVQVVVGQQQLFQGAATSITWSLPPLLFLLSKLYFYAVYCCPAPAAAAAAAAAASNYVTY